MAPRPQAGDPLQETQRSFAQQVAIALLGVLLIITSGCAGNLHGATSVYGPGGPVQPLEHGPIDEVKIGVVPGLGPVLVNGLGFTLYLFVRDHRSTPTCYQLCAVQWVPLELTPGVAQPIAGSGIKPRLLATVARQGGATQITYNRWPLYQWLPDTAPGEARGQGLNNLGGLWYVVNAAGDPVTS